MSGLLGAEAEEPEEGEELVEEAVGECPLVNAVVRLLEQDLRPFGRANVGRMSIPSILDTFRVNTGLSGELADPQERGGDGIGDSFAPIEREPMGSGQIARNGELGAEAAFRAGVTGRARGFSKYESHGDR